MRKAFTVLEMLVVVAIIGLLTGITLLYSRKTNKVSVLNRNVIKLISDISNAREMSLGFFSPSLGKKACGVGIHFLSVPSDKYYLFVDLVESNKSCKESDHKWTDASENLKVLSLEEGSFISAKSFDDLLFLPPNPDVIFDGATSTKTGSLVVQVDSFQKKITISQTGQISY